MTPVRVQFANSRALTYNSNKQTFFSHDIFTFLNASSNIVQCQRKLFIYRQWYFANEKLKHLHGMPIWALISASYTNKCIEYYFFFNSLSAISLFVPTRSSAQRPQCNEFSLTHPSVASESSRPTVSINFSNIWLSAADVVVIPTQVCSDVSSSKSVMDFSIIQPSFLFGIVEFYLPT